MKLLNSLLALAFVGLGVGCASRPPFEPKPAERPTPVHCFDSVGHLPGTLPFIEGGTCCCTPRPELMDDYRKAGLSPRTTADDLRRAYAEAGVSLGDHHSACNGLCDLGPHVVLGGHCMVPPTPATWTFEQVRFGMRYVPADDD